MSKPKDLVAMSTSLAAGMPLTFVLASSLNATTQDVTIDSKLAPGSLQSLANAAPITFDESKPPNTAYVDPTTQTVQWFNWPNWGNSWFNCFAGTWRNC